MTKRSRDPPKPRAQTSVLPHVRYHPSIHALSKAPESSRTQSPRAMAARDTGTADGPRKNSPQSPRAMAAAAGVGDTGTADGPRKNSPQSPRAARSQRKTPTGAAFRTARVPNVLPQVRYHPSIMASAAPKSRYYGNASEQLPTATNANACPQETGAAGVSGSEENGGGGDVRVSRESQNQDGKTETSNGTIGAKRPDGARPATAPRKGRRKSKKSTTEMAPKDQEENLRGTTRNTSLDPASSAPAHSEHTSSRPNPSRPAPSVCTPSSPAPSRPNPTVHTPSVPASSSRTPSRPAPSVRTPSDPAPSGPTPSRPAPSVHTPSRPAPSVRTPSGPAPSQAVLPEDLDLLKPRPGSALDPGLVERVEVQTRGQRTNPDWFRLRQNRITASVAHAVARSRFANGKASTPPTSYVRAIIGERGRVQTRAMAWGVAHEAEAVLRYQEQQSAARGHPVQVQDCGLFIDPARPWLAASPDGIVTDGEGRERRCLEVKCPFKHRERSVAAAAASDPHFCLEILHQEGAPQLSLKKTHPYFTQVQCQLAVTGLKMADFVVFTLTDLAVVPVRFDPDFWDQTVRKLELFYRDAVIPALSQRDLVWSPET